MGGARHPKKYKEGPAKPVTIPWKIRVLQKLRENEEKKEKPWNPDQLMSAIGAPKGSVNKLLNLELDQWTTKYLDEITEVLGVTPPVFETEEDDEHFASDMQLLRSLTPKSRAVLRITADAMEKKP